MNKLVIILILMLSICIKANAQEVSLKTNLFYSALTYTPNIGMEFRLNSKSTLDVSGGYNPWNLAGSENNNKKLVHWLGQAEYRYWFCQPFAGHFVGGHILGTQYNINQYKLPLLFGKDSEKYRYQGWGTGAGISYGYQFLLGERWNLEASLGLGYAWLQYDKYDCEKCGKKLDTTGRNYWGPTKMNISLIYIVK